MATKRKATRKITMVEFRAWLQGVEEMQSPDWTPDETQWKTIRAKIDTIKEVETAAPVKPAVAPHVPIPAGPIPRAVNPHVTQPATLVTNAQPADAEMTPAARQLLMGGKKTPDSESGGSSAFE